MTYFFTIVLLIYGSVHLYTFLRMRSALDFHIGIGFALAVFMLLMILTPFIVHLLEKRGIDRLAIIFSYIGYVWMGLIFFFFITSIFFDLYRLVIHIIEWIVAGNYAFLLPSAKQLFYIPLGIAVCIFVYAYGEALSVGSQHLILPSDKVPENIRSFRIVQISDVHIGLMIREGRLRSVLDLVKKAQPDLLISTGDLLDGQTDQIGEMASLLKEIKPPYGKIAIMGNHEYYAGFTQAHVFLKNAGFNLLRGEGETVADFLNIIGFDDEQGRTYGPYRDISPKTITANFPAGNFMLFLKHRPVVESRFGHFDLQLSGHTHGGQIFPFRYVTELFFPMNSGLFRFRDHSVLYVSRGSGTWGPPARFLTPPEITVIDLVHK